MREVLQLIEGRNLATNADTRWVESGMLQRARLEIEEHPLASDRSTVNLQTLSSSEPQRATNRKGDVSISCEELSEMTVAPSRELIHV